MLLLVLNNVNLCSMESEGIVIRIKTPVGDMDSLVDYPSHLNFNDLLVSCCFTCIYSVFPCDISVHFRGRNHSWSM